jgi:hypothetical protein
MLSIERLLACDCSATAREQYYDGRGVEGRSNKKLLLRYGPARALFATQSRAPNGAARTSSRNG